MYSKFLTVVLITALPFVSAVGNARVINSCSFPITLWSVGSSISSPSTLAAGGGTYSEPFTRDPQSGGRAIKITLDPNGLYDGAPQMDFAYNLDGGNVWYDLSDVFGDPFSGYTVVEYSTDTSCPYIEWDNGVSPGGSQVKVCESGSDVVLALCPSGSW